MKKNTTASDTQPAKDINENATAPEPASKITLFPVEAAIWRNTAKEGTFYAVTFARKYRDGAGNWRSSNSFNFVDLLPLAKAADLAHSKIIELRDADLRAKETST